MKTIYKIGIGFSLFIIMLVFLLPKFIKGYNFLDDHTCALPCLANITPQVTTETEAYRIASANKNFGSCNLVDQTKQGGSKYINCKSYKSNIIISLKDNLVDGLGIFPYPDISVKTIIDRFGYPVGISCGFVNLSDYPPRVKLILWIDKYYTTVDLSETSGNMCTLSAESKINSLGFGSKESYEESMNAWEGSRDFYPWEGFTTYKAKDLP